MKFREFIPAIAMALSSTVVASPAFADNRIIVEEFARDKVVRIDGRVGMQTAIRFGEDETIENVAIGDSVKWQVTPNKRTDLLFVKPLELAARTNMTVITNKRDYFFDLVAAPQSNAIYMLRFTYAGDARQGPVAAPKDGADFGKADNEPNGEERAVMALRTVKPEPVLAWTGKGNAKLFPSRIYDNGKATYLTWADDAPIPAIFVKDDSGAEGPVNYAVQGNTIVIAYVPKQIVLRTGKDAATLRPLGVPTKTDASTERPDHKNLAIATGQAIGLQNKGEQ